MGENGYHQSGIESVLRPLEARDPEIAPEVGSGDMHEDPDAPNPPSPTEAAESISQWRVAKSLLKLRDQIDKLAPGRSKASDGTIGDVHHCGASSSTSDHCPRIISSGVGVVAAMDVTNDPAHGCSAAGIAASLHASRDPRIKYIIWNRRIANSSAVGGNEAWAWRPYTGANPHDHHVHLSVKADVAQYDGEQAWMLEVDEPEPVTS